jgi:hypothetical protein
MYRYRLNTVRASRANILYYTFVFFSTYATYRYLLKMCHFTYQKLIENGKIGQDGRRLRAFSKRPRGIDDYHEHGDQ